MSRPRHAAPTHIPTPLRLLLKAAGLITLAVATFLLAAVFTACGPAYAATASSDPAASTATSPTAPTSPASPTSPEPCPPGEATGGTCGTDGAIASDGSPLTGQAASQPSPTSDQPARRCKGCRLSQEEYDARQADKQAAHDRAVARAERGQARRDEAARKRAEREQKRASRSSSADRTSRSSSRSGSKASTGSQTGSSTSALPDTSPDSSQAADGPGDGSQAYSSDTDASASDAAPLQSDVPAHARPPAPYDPSKDPAAVRREAARAAADAVASHKPVPASPSTATTSPTSPSPAPHAGHSVLGTLALAGLAGTIAYRRLRSGSRHLRHQRA